MRRKVTLSIAAAAVMIIMANNPVMADWEQANGAWNYKEDGQSVTNAWKLVNGKWYYFNEAGVMQSGWLEKDGKWFYLDPNNGDMKEGWVQDGENWYYLNSASGEMATGWTKTGENWYFMDNSGSMQTGVIDVDGKIYALDENGVMQTGTILLKEDVWNVYTFDPATGAAVGDKVPVPTKAYSSSGARQTDLSATVKDQVRQMQEKKKEEERASYTNSSSGSGSNRPSRPSEDTDNVIVSDVKIQEITVPKSGMVDVVLSKATKLDISNFYISCPAGKDMTILKVETEEGSRKNRVYHISTTHFNDNTYNMEITLSNGKKIEKTFVTSLSAPEIKEIETKRVDKNTAEISFISDSAGMLYYMAVPTNASRSMLRQAIGDKVPQTGQDVQKYGESMRMDQQGLQNITIKDLEEGQAYTIYLATAQEEGNTAALRGSQVIAAQPDDGDSNVEGLQIVEACAISDSKIKFVLNKPTDKALTLDDIDVQCANGDISIGGIETEDNMTYYIPMKPYYFMNSKTGYTVYVMLPDGSKLEKKFYTDFDCPLINEGSAVKISENEAEIKFRSDEGGVFYYITSDSSNKPSADEIEKNGQKMNLSGGWNKMTIKINQNDVFFYFVPEDLSGNRADFVEEIEIPNEIVEPTPEPDKETDIESITYSTNSIGYHRLTVKMKDAFDILNVEQRDIIIYALDNQVLGTVPSIVERGGTYDGLEYFYLQYNIVFPSGRYRLEFLYNGAYYEKEFEIK